MTDYYDIKSFIKELGISVDEMAEMYGDFIKEINLQTSELDTHLNNKDWKSMRRTIHNISGLASGYRISDLHEKAVSLSNAVKSEKYHDINEGTISLIKIWSLSKAFLIEYFSGEGIKLKIK